LGTVAAHFVLTWRHAKLQLTIPTEHLRAAQDAI
jgi:hypothetical protein